MSAIDEYAGLFRGFSSAAAATILIGCAHPTAVESPQNTSDRQATLVWESRVSLQSLVENNKSASTLLNDAKGVLVFPAVTKTGFLLGGFHADGILLKEGKLNGYYKMTAFSGSGLGVKHYGCALFFMNERALHYVDETGGWEVGVGPGVVTVDEGMGRSVISSTERNHVYAFIYNRRRLIAGGLQGSKITRDH